MSPKEATVPELLDPSFLRGASVESVLDFTQGHILEKHRRPLVWNLLLRFPADRAVAAEFLAWVRTRIPSVRDLQSHREKFRAGDRAGRHRAATASELPAVCFLGLSAAGADALGLAQPEWMTTQLRDGFRTRARDVFGLDLSDWDAHWHREEADRFHAILVCAGGHTRQLEEIAGWAKRQCAEVVVEKGFVLREEPLPGSHGPGAPIEHFGFHDGISQPVFFAGRDAHAPGWRSTYSPDRSLQTALCPETATSTPKVLHCGSYAAYMRIEQNCAEFEKQTAAVAAHLNQTGKCPAGEGRWHEYAKWLVMGKQRNGCPLVGGAGDTNDFSRSQDQSGTAWPHASHTAKMNPRTEPNSTLLVRRGIPYIEEETGAKGLLFQSFQSSLRKFETVFSDWALRPNQPGVGFGFDPNVGKDPILGDGSDEQRFPTTNPKAVKVGRVVTLRGGEYFYFPSIPAIEQLAATR